jgi:hypothetical protein
MEIHKKIRGIEHRSHPSYNICQPKKLSTLKKYLKE